MRKEIKTTGLEIDVRNPRFLVCDLHCTIADPPPPEQEWVVSPIQCLAKAVEWKPEIIVVSFWQISIRERDALVELSAVLKRNSHTQNCAVLALLHATHRKLIEDLKRAEVDYVRCIGDAKLDLNLVGRIIKDLGAGDRLDWHLERLCPFLHYSKIDSRHEMTVCRAYLNRMVLGGRRLHELCETGGHLHCEYYKHPRCKS